MQVEVSQQPALAAITVADAKAHLRVDHDAEDALIAGYIDAAQKQVEEHCSIVLITQTLQVEFDCFHAQIPLPIAPAQQIDAVRYVSVDGVLTTIDLSKYRLVDKREEPTLIPAYRQSWPSDAQDAPHAVLVEYVAGFGGIDDVPADIKQAILVLVGAFYQFREDASQARLHSLPNDATELLKPYRHWKM